MYNEIHNKIDILNISIDKKNQEQQQIDPPEYLKDAKKSKYGKPKFYKWIVFLYFAFRQQIINFFLF